MAEITSPIWFQTVPSLRFEPLAQDISADVCIVGGGISGLSIAYFLTRSRLRTVLLEKGELGHFTKHERLLIDREIADLEVMFGGLKGMRKIPDAMFIVDPRKEAGAIEEARQLNIPVISLLNSDCDLKGIKYPIPANDASVQSIAYVLDEVAKTYESNLAEAHTAASETIVSRA